MNFNIFFLNCSLGLEFIFIYILFQRAKHTSPVKRWYKSGVVCYKHGGKLQNWKLSKITVTILFPSKMASSKMRVEELRTELHKRGLSITGTKPTLVLSSQIHTHSLFLFFLYLWCFHNSSCVDLKLLFAKKLKMRRVKLMLVPLVELERELGILKIRILITPNKSRLQRRQKRKRWR